MFNYLASPSLTIASQIMHQGGVIAYPTEAVWGLGCDPFDAQAVNTLLSLKKRSPDKGLILIGSDIEQFSFILKDLKISQIDTMQKTWPGPVTWIVPINEYIPYWISGNHQGVAIRVSNHPIVKSLCDIYGGPIVSTSANTQGHRAAKSKWQVKRYFKNNADLDFITQGVVGKRDKPSHIFDLLTQAVIR
jgi:L-threonylcarbamoyladenylate synthase